MPVYEKNIIKRIKRMPKVFPESARKFWEGEDKYMFYCESVVDLLKAFKDKELFTHPWHTSSHDLKEGDWSGTRNFEDALKILKYGVPDIKKILQGAETVSKQNFKDKEFEADQYQFANAGEFFDVGEVLSGSPNPFLTSKSSFRNEKFADIVINTSFNSGVDSKTVLENMKKIIAVVKRLELSKIRVRITAVNMTRISAPDEGRITYCLFFPIKEYNGKFDYKKLSSFLHPSFLRRIIFRWQEITNIVSSGYGRAEQQGYVINLANSLDTRQLLRRYEKTNKKKSK